MKIGIVGLPNIGKSTLFNALTKSYAADASNFPFCTIDPNIGIVDVMDERVDKLSKLSSSVKTVYSTIKFVDIAGLMRGASKGEGMGNAFLSHVREVDAIVQVLRHFKHSGVNHVEGNVDVMRDVEIINTELILCDLEQIDKKLPALQKKAKGRDEEVLKEVALLGKVQSFLEAGKLMFDMKHLLSDVENLLLKSFNFLTFKPFVYVLNIGEEEIGNSLKIRQEYADLLQRPVSVVCAKLETEMMEMSGEEREMLLGDGGDTIPTLDDLIALAFDTVGLMYFFTTGPKETKSWTVKKGSTAPQAAGVIHSDFERGFIKAEVINADVLLSVGGWSQGKSAGKVRLEGKEYIVQDGDVMFFKFNV